MDFDQKFSFLSNTAHDILSIELIQKSYNEVFRMTFLIEHKRIKRYIFSALLLYGGLYYGGLFMLKEPQAFSDLMSIGGEALTFWLLCAAQRLWPPEERQPWIFFATGMGLYTLGDFYWYLMEVPLGMEVPSPSLCDALYLVSCLFYLLALIHYIRQENRQFLLESSFNILISLLVSTAFIFKYTMLPLLQDPSLSLLSKGVNMMYPVFDLGFLAGIFSLLFYGTQKPVGQHQALFFIMASFILQFAADQLYTPGIYDSGSLLDPLWPISAGLLVLAALSPAPVQRTAPKFFPVKSPALHNAALLLPYLLTIALLILVIWQHIGEDPLISLLTITILAIFLRQLFIQQRNQQLLALVQKSNAELLQAQQQLEEQNQQLSLLSRQKEKEAHTDFLTGLFNRRYINHLLHSLPDTEKAELQIGLILIDIDFFKQINDSFGHQAGDQVLYEFGRLLSPLLHPEKRLAGRFGGDEFLILFQETSAPELEDFAQQLLQAANATPIPALSNGRISLSIGITHWRGPSGQYNADQLVHQADLALYQAKNTGRHKYVFFFPELANIHVSDISTR